MNLDEVARLLGVPYTDEQRAIIGAPPDAPLQIIAGAGSGKTTVMAARVLWLVGGGHVRSEQILGLTFTNKAAASLATKIRDALGALAGSAHADDPLEPTVSTYHAYAGRLVREHGLRVGVEPESRLLADATRFQLAHRVMRNFYAPLPSLRWVPDTVVSRLIALEGSCSDHLVDPAGLRERECERALELAAQADLLNGQSQVVTRQRELRDAAAVSRARAELCELIVAYRGAKRAADAADFGDQIAAAVRIAQGAPEAVTAERDRFRVVLLDEYQDTSVAQSRLLAALFGDGRGVTAVGDPCQAIYGWRGASVANLADFPRQFRRADQIPAAVVGLRTSQRSGGRLLHLANRLSEALRGESVAELGPRADRVDVGEVIVARHERYDDERRWIAGQVQAQLAAGVAPAEIAVLLRAWRHAAPLHQALSEAGVPAEVVGLGGLLSLPEVVDVVTLLTLLDDPTANAALLRHLAGPRWMFGAQDLRALGAYAARAARGTGAEVDPLDEAAAGVDPTDIVAIGDALDAVARGRAVPGLSAAGARRSELLHRELVTLRRAVGEPLPDLIARVVATIGLDVETAASPEAVAARRRSALGAFSDVAATYVDLDGGAHLHGFLGYLRAAEDYDRGFDNPLEVGGDAVQILTMHKAKGLEWDVVVLPDLTHKSFPSQNNEGRWHTNIGELPYRERQDAASLPVEPDFASKDWKKDFEDRCKAHELREEDRLAYVALTRARHTVIASNAVWGPTQATARAASPYLLALRDHAEAGYGRVEVWTPDPPAAARNPYLDAAPTPWPRPLDQASFGARMTAARAVSRGGGGPDPLADSVVSGADRERYAEYDRELEALLTEARTHRATALDVALPAALSASQVLALHADPDRLAAELARPMPRRPSAAAERGTTFHRWVEERFALTPLLDAEAIPGAADQDAPADAELAALKAAFATSAWFGRTPYAVEAGFAIVLGGRVVRSRIDAVYALGPDEPDGVRWHVIDWKTGREFADPVQLAIYRTAWARRCGCAEAEVRASFLHIRTDELLTPTLLDPAALEALVGGG